MTDADRERLIEAWRVVIELDEPEEKAFAVLRQRRLIQERSPRQVREMEAIQGLR
jgi:hypothetical protein